MIGARKPFLTVKQAHLARVSARDRFDLSSDEFEIFAGDRIAIVGPSGSGKTSLIELLGLIYKPDRALAFEFFFEDGQKLNITPLVTDLSNRQYVNRLSSVRARRISIVPQRNALLPTITVRRNIAIHPALQSAQTEVIQARIDDVMDQLGIRPLAAKRPGELSGGEQQRVALARALIARPNLIIADEPTAQLDRANKLLVVQLLTEIALQTDTAVVIATHDTDLVENSDFEVVAGEEGTTAGGLPLTTFNRRARGSLTGMALGVG